MHKHDEYKSAKSVPVLCLLKWKYLFFHFVCSCEVSQTFVFAIRSSCVVLHICRQLSAQYRTVVGVSFLIIYVGFDRSAAVVKWAVLECELRRCATSQSYLESY